MITNVTVRFFHDKNIIQVSEEPKKEFTEICGNDVKDFVRKYRNFVDGVQELENLSLSDSEESYLPSKPTALVESGPVDSEKSFNFGTPRKCGTILENLELSMEKVHLESQSPPKTSKSRNSKTRRLKSPKTPMSPLAKTPIPMSPLARGDRTPNSRKKFATPVSNSRTARRSLRTLTRSSTAGPVASFSTPKSVRRKVKTTLKKMVQEPDSDADYDYLTDSESSFSSAESSHELDSSSDSEWDKSNRMGKSVSKQSTPLRTPRRGRLQKVDVDMVGSNSDEFFLNKGEKYVTSDNTLNRLPTPRLGAEALQSLLEGVHTAHENECNALMLDHATYFPCWMSLMFENFSIFLSGVGSKKALLTQFQSDFLSGFDHLVINGFFPSLTIKSILATIISEIMELKTYSNALVDQVALIEKRYNSLSEEDPLFLIIHNLDGPMLRNEKSQEIVGQISSFKNVHLVASLDHINSPLLFDGKKYSLYNPLWYDVTTFLPYTEETSYENSLLVQQSGGLGLSSLIHVFKSLTPNAKGIFLILVKDQLAEVEESNYQGLSFNDLYQKCSESFLVNSDLTLRAQLTEFKDHKLIKTKKGVDTIENLFIPLEKTILEEFLEHQNDFEELQNYSL